MTLPINRTALIAAQTNQVPSQLIQSALNIAAIQAPYDGIDELYNFTTGLIAANSLITQAITPDVYSGTDAQKLQSAFDAALLGNKAVLLSRVYDITGSTITINKSILTRLPLYIFSQGGGIYKTDAGFMFTGIVANIADIFFESVFFRGNPSVAVKVFDCSTIIGLNTTNCFYKDITTIMYTDDTRYLQSIRMINDKIIGCKGAALDFAGAYDVTLNNVMIEASTGSFINHRALGSNPGIYNFRMRDGIYEGMSGANPAIKFMGSIESLVIDGCYFETNAGGHIVFDSNAILRSVKIENCRHGGAADVAQLIVWGKTLYGCFTNNNIAQNIGIHNATNVTAGRVLSIYDRRITAGVDIPNSVIDYVKYALDALTAITGGFKQVWGSMTRLTVSLLGESFTAGEVRKLTFTFPENIYSDDVITEQVFTNLSNKHFSVSSKWRDPTTKTIVYMYVKNNEADTQVITIRCNVLKTMPTALG